MSNPRSTTPDQFELKLSEPVRFDGETYVPTLDERRLALQARRVFDCMKDQQWRTLAAIEDVTLDPQASISARLRDFRKRRFGAWNVERRRRGNPTGGVHEYRLSQATADAGEQQDDFNE